MIMERREAGYKVSKEFLAFELGIEEEITHMSYDQERACLLIYVRDEKFNVISEGGAVPLLRAFACPLTRKEHTPS